MKRIKLILASFAVVVLGTVAFVSPAPVLAINPLQDTCSQSGSGDNPICQNSDEQAEPLIKTIINVLLFIIGALAVVMIIWSGIRYVTSAGNSSSVTAAKNTLMYSVIGLIVAFLAYAIVNWVLTIF